MSRVPGFLAATLMAVGIAVPVVLAPGGGAAQAHAAVRPLEVVALSNRPDLVSGDDVLVAVRPATGLRLTRVKVTLNGADVSGRFQRRAGYGYAAYLTGLRPGRNQIRATAPGFAGSLVVTNHGDGPVFSGPATEHYQCQDGATDADCGQPATYTYLYRSTNPLKGGLQAYDPQHPATDVATTTSSTGVTVPFIVMREDGIQDRDRYAILTLVQPGKPWHGGQPQFNHKILMTHGGGCGASYAPGDPPLADFSGTLPVDIPLLDQSYVTALGRGFSVISTALDNTGHNCNVAMNAESLMMAKEHFVEHYGRIRYTIGTGCSGGSIAQHTVANAYPGIYQGLITTCSYPDTFTAGAQFADYHLLRLYFEHASKWGPGVLWTEPQMAAVEGHLSVLNSITADEGLFKSALNPESACPGTDAPVAGDPTTRYDDQTNPGGVRCSVLDLLVNALGRRPESVWGAEEKAVGHGFGGIPFSNTGVLYGLSALKSGLITPAMFVDLNAKIGGLDVDSRPTQERIAGDPVSVANAYRTGLVNEADHLDQVAMINFGGPDPGLAHDYAHAFWTEERLQRAQGNTDNRVMWFGVTPLIGDPRWANEALTKMDRWLRAVERDHSSAPLARKIASDRPADVTDRCFNVPGLLQTTGADGQVHCLLPDELQLRLSTPRQEAGGPSANDVLDCHLTPLERSDVDGGPLSLSDSQWAALQALYPDGVCDYSQPGVGQGPAETWLTYFSGDGTSMDDGVVYGGRPLPAVAPHQADLWASASFHSLVRE